jgi:hypothetical protein
VYPDAKAYWNDPKSTKGRGMYKKKSWNLFVCAMEDSNSYASNARESFSQNNRT